RPHGAERVAGVAGPRERHGSGRQGHRVGRRAPGGPAVPERQGQERGRQHPAAPLSLNSVGSPLVGAGTQGSPSRLRDLRLLRQVRDRIDRDYAQPLDVPSLARQVHMSAGHLSRQFKEAYGESPYSYLMTRRIERAMTLLRRGDLSVTDI